MTTNTVPRLRHSMCRNPDCWVCLKDAITLGEYFEDQTGCSLVDHLGEYRRFMDTRLGRSSETEYGWFHPAVFDVSNVKAYIKTWDDDGLESEVEG